MMMNYKLLKNNPLKQLSSRIIYKYIFNPFSNNHPSKTNDSQSLSPKFEPIKVKPKFHKISNSFYQKQKKVYNLIVDGDFENFKLDMMNCSVLEQLDFYDQNKNNMNDLFHDSFLIILSQKIEISSYEHVYLICNKLKKQTMSEIVEKMKKSSHEIKSKSNLFSNICLFYVIGLKELKYFNREEIESLIKIYTKYLTENLSNFTFSEKLQITTAIAHFQNTNFNTYLSEDFYEIEKIGYFELTKIMHRITKFKSSYQTKFNLISLIVHPYIKMSLENSLNNKVNAFFLLNLYSSELLNLNLLKETEEILNHIIIEFDELRTKSDIKDLLQFKWLELFKGLSSFKGKIDKNFLKSVYDVLFEKILINLKQYKHEQQTELDEGINLYKFLVVLYRISLLSVENLPDVNHLQKFFKYINNNSKEIENLLSNISQQHMLGIFLLMKKTNYSDLEVIKLFTKLLQNKLYLYDISDNSIAYKEIIKEKLKEENLNYQTIKNTIVDNTYNYSIKRECRFLPLMKHLGASCFYSEKSEKKLDAAFYVLLDKMNENKEIVNINSNFLHYYVENHQNNLLPEYRKKIIKKFLEIFTKDKISQIAYGSAIIKCYMYLNQLKLPESDYDETKTKILQLIAHIQKLTQFKSNFAYQLKSYAWNKFAISNSAIVSIVITLKSLYKDLFRIDDLHLFQNYLISFVYFAVVNDISRSLERDALNSLLETVDEITLITSGNLRNKKFKACFDMVESFEIYFIFLKNGLKSDVLQRCYLNNVEEFEEMNLSYGNLSSLYIDEYDLIKSKDCIRQIKNFIANK